MLTPDRHREVMTLLPTDDSDSRSAINAILCAAFRLKGMRPVTVRGKHTFETQWGPKEFDEYPGQLRGETGWLSAPRYMSSIDDACGLIRDALGGHWIVEVQIRLDGSTAQLHEFPLPCRRSGVWRGKPGPEGAAQAIVRCLLEITQPL